MNEQEPYQQLMVDHTSNLYSFRWIHRVADIAKDQWNALAMPLATPFFEWDWLHSLEASGSATPRAGWTPCHLTAWKDKELVAIAPLYQKKHSYGEFIFDHDWANVAYQLGIEYYPKLLGMSPFTPAEGYQFLMAPGEDEDELTRQMVSEIDHFCDRHNISGCNFLYVDSVWQQRMERLGFVPWLHHSYVWQNEDYQSFDDYLKAFNANQRRNIKRERKAMSKAGIQMQVLAGEEIPKSHFSLMYEFYSDTCDKFGWWGSKYLTRRFFEQLHSCFRERVVFASAHVDDVKKPIGMSFCLTKGDRLYGRYWGSSHEIDNLHFNACYYSPIEWAIENNIKIFDPGAGGRHKKRRGFPARANYSLHRFYNKRMQDILEGNIDMINRLGSREIEAANQDLPFSFSN